MSIPYVVRKKADLSSGERKELWSGVPSKMQRRGGVKNKELAVRMAKTTGFHRGQIEGNIHYFKLHFRFTRYLPRQLHFLLMLLPIQKAQRIYFPELTLCPKQASCRILPTAEYDQCCFFIHLIIYL